MGCCVSSHLNKTIPQHQHNNNNHFPCVSKSPPQPEQETVKEVLSETPKPKPIIRPDSPAREDNQPTKFEPFPDPDPCTHQEVSASEMCSISESICTNTLKEHSQPDQKVNTTQGYNGNFVHQQQYNSVRNKGRSPTRRRPQPSPPRKRNTGQSVLMSDNSTRRSQSPGVRNNVGRSPSVMKSGPSPGRVRMVHGSERRDSEEWEGPKESLENPLVSLECFIFL